LKNLKKFNEKRRLDDPLASYVFVTDYLPKMFELQRKKLQPQFKEARKYGQKTSWKIINGNYCLFIDDAIVIPQQ